MTKTTVGLYDSFTDAQAAVRDLVDNGFPRDDISLIASDESGEYAGMIGSGTVARDEDIAESTGAGVVGGSILGGALGLLVGVGALTIPGIGPVLAAGPLAAAIGSTALGAGVGAAAGGLIGGLTGAGVPEEDASLYIEGVRRGGTLVVVRSADDRADLAASVMQRHGVVNIDQRGAEWREHGWNSSTVQSSPYESHPSHTSTGQPVERAVGMSDFGAYETDFRSHFDSYAAGSGYTYDQYLPVYQYGYNLATAQRYRDQSWDEIEPEVQRRWDERNPGTWDRFRDSVRYAWDRVRNQF